MPDKQTPFEILGIAADASPKEIRAAFRERSKVLHPDHGGDPLDFHNLKEAYDEAMEGIYRKRCLPCKGTGRIHHSGGTWGAVSLNCSDCRGTGKKFKEK